MSRRRQPSIKLPDIPKTHPTVESLKEMDKRRQMYSSDWFNLYDSLRPDGKAEYHRYLHKKNPSFTFSAIKTTIEQNRKIFEKKRLEEEKRKKQLEEKL